MMDRSSLQRILKLDRLLNKAEEIIKIALKKREDHVAELLELFRPQARFHAVAVAAIVIAGEPKIDEPLVRAWGRTLRHYGITITNEYGREYEYEDGHEHEHEFRYEYERELRTAYDKLYAAIIKGDNETEKFTEIFRSAPIWLLQFTLMGLDAQALKFDLPEMPSEEWEEKLKYAQRWPLLPLGTMAGGEPVYAKVQPPSTGQFTF
jgi:hypothetical protein